MHNIRVKRLETSTLRFKMEGDDCIRLFPVIGSSDGFKLSNAQHLFLLQDDVVNGAGKIVFRTYVACANNILLM